MQISTLVSTFVLTTHLYSISGGLDPRILPKLSNKYIHLHKCKHAHAHVFIEMGMQIAKLVSTFVHISHLYPIAGGLETF